DLGELLLRVEAGVGIDRRVGSSVVSTRRFPGSEREIEAEEMDRGATQPARQGERGRAAAFCDSHGRLGHTQRFEPVGGELIAGKVTGGGFRQGNVPGRRADRSKDGPLRYTRAVREAAVGFLGHIDGYDKVRANAVL